jgi:calcineurin-like phosphoesterase family protein
MALSIVATPMSTTHQIVILHISDLHFGWDGDENKRTDRTLALRGLLSQLEHLAADWQPNVVCISGDIGWRGHRSDYEDAKQWICQLLKQLQLSAEALIMCPGNHDLDRDVAKRNARPNSPAEADEVLGIPIPEHFQKPFQAFADFCKDLGIPPFFLGTTETYLVGQRSFQDLHFVSYNSAWFCKGDDDRSKLWIGLPLVRCMESKDQLPSPTQLHTWPATIALMHHPKEWFHEAETQAWGNRPNTFDYLSQRCHLLLTGHTHGEVRLADQYAEGTWHLSGGATYAGASHFNSFRSHPGRKRPFCLSLV